jgi:hypothetical protein
MAYLGNAPARSFISFERQVFTIVNSQTAYTLDHSVNNENDIRLVVNNIVQEPGSGKAYTASGTTLTLSAALTNGTDEMYCVFLGRATATNAPGAGSVNTATIAADAITEAKIADDAVESEHLNNNVISGQTELAAEPADTDEFLVSDAGTLKRIDYSYIKGSAGLTLLSSGSVTSTTSQIQITGTQVSDTYEHYRFYLSGKPTNDAPSMNLRFRNSSNDGLITSGYSLSVKRLGATNDQLYSNSYSTLELTNRVNSGNDANEGFNLVLDFMSPRSNSVPTVCMWHVTNASTTDTFTYQTGAGRRNDGTEVHTGFTIYFSAGDFAEYEYQFYGLQKS